MAMALYCKTVFTVVKKIIITLFSPSDQDTSSLPQGILFTMPLINKVVMMIADDFFFILTFPKD